MVFRTETANLNIMKTLIFTGIVLSLTTSSLFGQKGGTPKLLIDEETKRITYTEVVMVDSSTSKNEDYSRGREWFAKAYKSSTDVIQWRTRKVGKL